MASPVAKVTAGSRVIEACAYASLAIVFVLDAFTPQALSIQIAYEVSVVLAALTGRRALIVRLLTLTLILNLLGSLTDAAQDGYRWDVLGVENRAISLISIFLVGALALTIQSRSERLGRATANAGRERVDAALLAAVHRFWTSLEPQSIAKTVTEEAIPVFETPVAIWCPSDLESPLWVRTGLASEAAARERPAAGSSTAAAITALSTLQNIETFPAGERLAALGGGEALTPYFIGIPVAQDDYRFGVLLIGHETSAPDAATLHAAAEYALRTRAAMNQARLLERLRRRNDLLSSRQEVLQDLVGAISHDVRTPLMALSVTLAQAQDGAYGALPSDYTAVLTESRSSIEGIQRLAETLLLVARFEAEKPRDDPEAIQLPELVSDVAAELTSVAEAVGLNVRTDVPPDATIEGTRSDVRRAISNLLANAIRNTPAGGTIDLRVRRTASEIELAVLDDGYGVQDDVRESLFQRFSKGGGTGLGLYIVRRIAEESGGHARYEARAPHGSAFILSFPRSPTIAA